MTELFNLLIVQPIFNLLVVIIALLPGHNFGLAIIIFTIIIRLFMWPLIKKQLHHSKALRELQPELKKIKKAANGDKQQESRMVMELYKEREINPFAPIGILIVQAIILIGLYIGLNRVVMDPKAFIENSYGFLQGLPWLQALAGNIKVFDETLFGFVDLSRAAFRDGQLYWPALVLVAASAYGQYRQSAQIMPKAEDGRTLRAIFKESAEGKVADSAEVAAAMNQKMLVLIPAMVFIFTIALPSALSLYWLVGAIVAYIQQGIILRRDQQELSASVADEPKVLEGEIIEPKPKPKKPKKKPAKKRRK